MTPMNSWFRDQRTLLRQAQEEEAARARERLEQMEGHARAKRMAAVARATPPPPATAGRGWRVLENPRINSGSAGGGISAAQYPCGRRKYPPLGPAYGAVFLRH